MALLLNLRHIRAKFIAGVIICFLIIAHSLLRKEWDFHAAVSEERSRELASNQDITASKHGLFYPSPGCRSSWGKEHGAISHKGAAIQLRTSRFLYAVLPNGPNNQLIGLRDAVYLAVRLNRTIILPFFRKHRTDGSLVNGTKIIPAAQRIDVRVLSRLVPLVAHDKIKRVCPGGFEDVYLTSERARHLIKGAVAHTGVQVITTTGELNVFPQNIQNFDALHNVTSKKSFLRKLYSSSGRCAVYSAPFRTVGVSESPGALRRVKKKYFTKDGVLRKTNIDADTIPDGDIYALITESIIKPRFVYDIVDGFMSSSGLQKSRYISVHWRYDQSDWLKRCGKSTLREEVSSLCKHATNASPDDLAIAIAGFVEDHERSSSETVDAVYFAAPLTIKPFIEKVQATLKTRVKLAVFTQKHLKHYLEKFSDCNVIQDSFEDVFSQLEMDICSRANVFLRSPSSSWSKVIATKRVVAAVNGQDRDILSLVEEVMRGRLAA